MSVNMGKRDSIKGLLAALAIWHIMQQGREEVAFLELLSVLDLMLNI
jgi:hypothetical protein